jgi:3-hydroxyacyl-CoA dehydrogenase / enoyl-CoA hydratase / 3-hydroxybutyryl-CoA epimerase
MAFTHFRLETDADGILTAFWDSPDKSMNIITREVMDEIDALIDHVAARADLRGCVIISGKAAFSGGADLAMLQALGTGYETIRAEKGEDEAMRVFLHESSRLSRLYRKLEICGKPFAIGVHGVCLGGGFELALACHYRILCEDETTRIGLPEIKVGIFPGAGGTQRVARLMPTGEALQMLFKGEQIKPQAAKAMGLVHALCPRDAVLETAKDAIRNGLSPKAPWDQEGYKLPSGKVYSAAGMQIWPAANGIYRRETHGNYPAARAILSSVYEGLQVSIDVGLRIESRYFAKILRSTEAAAMIRTLFLSMQDLNKGARRPKTVPPSNLQTLGIIGAGFMGAGIAYVSALAGLNVILLDRDIALAEKGKALSHTLMSSQILKGKAKTAEREALLSRITPGTDMALLKACDLVIEAVYEDPKVKAQTLAKASAAMKEGAILASNTSTLPISDLAHHAGQAPNMIGIHFFSPVEKMMLVEIIRGRETGDTALAMALDYVRKIKKTPIVVNDSRGFYANRCVLNYVRESHLMLLEGIPPAMIEMAGKMAGMPVGPLALNDEVALDLALRILRASKTADPASIDPAQEALLVALVDGEGRLGRKNGKGFYDYPMEGDKTRQKRLWPGLAAFAKTPVAAEDVNFEELKQRLLVTQALEAARTVEEGVITDVREADIGSILGFGFAPFTGGTLSMIDGMGASAFVALCQRLQAKFGARFTPNSQLVAMAKAGERYYKAA